MTWKGATSPDVYVVPFGAFNLVPIPGVGLGGSSNYVLANNCHDLKNLSVTIEITEDMVLESVGAPVPGSTQFQGFGFQLNSYSPPGFALNCAYQQYVMTVLGNELGGTINNYAYGPYGPNGTLTTKQVTLQTINVATLARPNILPRGYRLAISLVYGQNEIITGANFSVVDNHGKVLPVATLLITGVPSQDLAPIVAFELDIVGPGNGEAAVLSSGAGTILYSASSALGFLSTEPNNCGIVSVGTAERANTSYSVLTVYPSNPIVQSFKVAPSEKPLIHRLGKTRPPLPLK